jgi:hypothetical protein
MTIISEHSTTFQKLEMNRSSAHIAGEGVSGTLAITVSKVDLLEREAVEASRNFIRRSAILKEAETVYG